MKGTKLWSEPRSPLIQGRSRSQRPLWRDWLATALGAWMIASLAVVLIFDGITTGRSGQLAATAGTISLVTAGPVVWFARRLGTRDAWKGSALVTGVVAAVAQSAIMYVSVSFLGK